MGLPTASPRKCIRHMRPTNNYHQPTRLLKLRQASATTVHGTERALQRQPRATKNLASRIRKLNGTRTGHESDPRPGVSAARVTASLLAATLSSLLVVSLWVRPATASSPVGSSSAVQRAAPDGAGYVRESGIVVVTGFRGRRHRIKVGHSGRFSISLPRRPLSRGGRHTSAGMEVGRVLRGFAFAPSLDHVVAGSTTRITVDCHRH